MRARAIIVPRCPCVTFSSSMLSVRQPPTTTTILLRRVHLLVPSSGLGPALGGSTAVDGNHPVDHRASVSARTRHWTRPTIRLGSPDRKYQVFCTPLYADRRRRLTCADVRSTRPLRRCRTAVFTARSVAARYLPRAPSVACASAAEHSAPRSRCARTLPRSRSTNKIRPQLPCRSHDAAARRK